MAQVNKLRTSNNSCSGATGFSSLKSVRAKEMALKISTLTRSVIQKTRFISELKFSYSPMPLQYDVESIP